MLFILSYYLVSGGLFYGVFYFLKEKRNINFEKYPLIIGLINGILAVFFLGYYLMNPAAFSPETTISSPVLYFLMAVFSIYFYAVAPGLSISSMVLITHYKKHHSVSQGHFIRGFMMNAAAVICFFILTYNLFA